MSYCKKEFNTPISFEKKEKTVGQEKEKYETLDVMMCIIVFALFMSFLLLEQMSWGRYIFLFLCFLAYIVVIVSNGGDLEIKLDAYHFQMIGFIIVTLMTSVWAIKSSEPIEKAITNLEILICFYPIYEYFSRENKIKLLITTIKWAGFLLSIYTIWDYGFSSLLMASLTDSNRLVNSFSNVNQIAQILALACIIEYWDVLQRRCYSQTILLIPCIFVIMATQSRKAFIFIVVGYLLVTVLNGVDKENDLKLIGSIFGGICILTILLFLFTKIRFSQGLLQRMQMMINLFVGEGKVDSSALNRKILIDTGLKAWKNHPIGGIGIGCSHYLANEAIGHNYYLHNNYVELLSGGGIVGFVSYYWLHIYLIIQAWRNRKNSKIGPFIISWIILILIMDYGKVSFYSKIQWIYLLTVCIGVNSMKKNDKEAHPCSTYCRN